MKCPICDETFTEGEATPWACCQACVDQDDRDNLDGQLTPLPKYSAVERLLLVVQKAFGPCTQVYECFNLAGLRGQLKNFHDVDEFIEVQLSVEDVIADQGGYNLDVRAMRKRVWDAVKEHRENPIGL